MDSGCKFYAYYIIKLHGYELFRDGYIYLFLETGTPVSFFAAERRMDDGGFFVNTGTESFHTVK